MPLQKKKRLMCSKPISRPKAYTEFLISNYISRYNMRAMSVITKGITAVNPKHRTSLNSNHFINGHSKCNSTIFFKLQIHMDFLFYCNATSTLFYICRKPINTINPLRQRLQIQSLSTHRPPDSKSLYIYYKLITSDHSSRILVVLSETRLKK